MTKLFDRLRIGPRLILAFMMVLLVMASAAGIGIWRLNALHAIAHELGGPSAERAVLARELQAIAVLSAARAEMLLKTNDLAFAERIMADRKSMSARSAAVRKRLEELSDDEHARALFSNIDMEGDNYRSLRDSLIKKKAASGSLPDDDIRDRLLPASSKYAAAVESMAEYQAQRVIAERRVADENHRTGIAMLVMGICVGSLIAFSCAWALTRSIVRPLATASDLAERVANGDLTTALASSERKNEVQALVADLIAMQRRLAGLVRNVHTASESITTASKEIALGNLDLSTRTEEAATNLQDTASYIAQLTNTVKLSAEAAATASSWATSAYSVAERGGQVVTQVVSKMNSIAGASGRIVDIIGVIDGIAFQTNILALNAAVEAARAGEQGRGFAVVASEVRSLAQRSAAAAREIKELIHSSVDEVASGKQLVEQAGSTMAEVVTSVQRVNHIVQQFSASAAEQYDSIEYVNNAVTQLDRVTQQNAALVEESSAATESLKEQVLRLSGVVHSFKLS